MGVLSVALKRDKWNWGYTEKMYVINHQGICVGCFYIPIPDSMSYIKCCFNFKKDYFLHRASILSKETKTLYDQQLKETSNVRHD